MIFNLMNANEETTQTNDYAVARELNLLVMGMVMNIYLANEAGISSDIDINELNRAYIQVVDELQKLYNNNPKLSAIKPEPIWKRFDVLKASTRGINKHISDPDNDYGSAHYARVEKLCILGNAETPNFTPEQQKLKEYADEIVTKNNEMIEEAFKENKSDGKVVLSASKPHKVIPHPLEPRHYSVRKGVLTLSPTQDVAIVANGKTKRPDGTKYLQCVVMDKLFKSVKNIKSGINFSTVLTVHESKIGKKEEKKIRNAVAEINNKVASVGGPDNLIKIQNKKIFVNNSYLE